MEEVKLIGKGELQIGMIESVKYWIPKVIFRYNKVFSEYAYSIDGSVRR